MSNYTFNSIKDYLVDELRANNFNVYVFQFHQGLSATEPQKVTDGFVIYFQFHQGLSTSRTYRYTNKRRRTFNSIKDYHPEAIAISGAGGVILSIPSRIIL